MNLLNKFIKWWFFIRIERRLNQRYALYGTEDLRDVMFHLINLYPERKIRFKSSSWFWKTLGKWWLKKPIIIGKILWFPSPEWCTRYPNYTWIIINDWMTTDPEFLYRS